MLLWLEKNHGFTNLYNLKGGVLAWAREIDPEFLELARIQGAVARAAGLATFLFDLLTPEEAERMTGELNVILGFVEQLGEVDVSNVEPMISVTVRPGVGSSGRPHAASKRSRASGLSTRW